MTEAMHIETRLNKELDATCQQMLWIMMVKDIFEEDKIRYNALYAIVNQIVKLSKPTFQTHIRHLISKKFVMRQKEGKQTVYLYLNLDNMMIKNERIMKREIEEDTRQLQAILEKPESWRVKIANVLAFYGFLCNLRRWKSILQYMFTPNRSKENLLALAYQARYQELLEDTFILSLSRHVDKFPSEEQKKEYISFVMKMLDQDIEKFRNGLKELAEKTFESKL